MLAFGLIAGAYAERGALALRIKSVYVKVPPKAADGRLAGNAKAHGQDFPDARWALSALPECLIQTADSSGTAAYARAHLPAGARRVAAGSTLRYADCRIAVRAHDALVTRGADRFHIPARAAFYRLGTRLYVLERTRTGRAELRSYEPSNIPSSR